MEKYECPKCKHIGMYIIKLGGLICEKCRVILFTPETEEYKNTRKKI